MRNHQSALESHKGSYLAVMLLAFSSGLAAILVAAYSHGLWYDELFTLYVTRPGLELGFALRNYWLADNHPPLYYFMSWATNFLGDAVEPRRLLNLTGFFGACLVLAQVWRKDAIDRGILTLFVLGMLASQGFAGLAAELRSYFLSLLVPGLLAILLVALRVPREEANHRNHFKQTAIMLGLVSAVALNLHFITTIVSCALLGAFFLRAVIQKDRATRNTVCIVGVIGIIPFLVFTAYAFSNLEANTRNFWAEPGLRAGGHILAETALRSSIDIWPLVVLAVPAIGGLIHRLLHRRPLDRFDIDLLTLFGALGLFVAALFAVQSIRPVIVDYYLVCATGPATLLCAMGAGRTLGQLPDGASRVVLVFLGAWSLIMLGHNTLRSLDWPSSYTPSAQFVRDVVRDCPTTIVHRDPYPHKELTALPPDENRVVSLMSYQVLADRYRFDLAPWDSRAMSRECPTLFWSNNDNARDRTEAVLYRLRAQGYPVSRLRRHQLGSGVVHAAPPER